MMLFRLTARVYLLRRLGGERTHLSTSTRFYDKKLFEKILVANRGEIAARILKTCKKMGIPTVAVYSEADERMLFVQRADEAVLIGPPPSLKSYLCIDAIVAACKKTGATAVHPGYGFLSENHAFAAALESNGITFIGPHSETIKMMGDKIFSKQCAQEANVNVVTGFDGVIRDETHALEIAHSIGFPVMIKAVGGGGGRGMRTAYNDKEVKEGFRLSSQEAKSSFGDDRILIEKFVEEPRHIEFQILGDKHGNVVHLNERECSIQRRNQKVIEEAPSPFLDPQMRQYMGEQAVRLAKKTGYYSAGTIEFLVDKCRNFYFLEMNTRLQVEHPVTEAITGVDLVEQMIKIAAGEKLDFDQSMVPLKGWSVEVRINAENPYRNFGTPSIGRITRYKEPSHLPNVRLDSGVMEGSEITMYYDSLISKLITYGENRLEAIENVREALDGFVIRGVRHNMPLIRDIMDNKDFCSGDINTKYLESNYPEGFKGRVLSSRELDQLCCCGLYSHLAKEAAHSTNSPSMSFCENEKFYLVLPEIVKEMEVVRANLPHEIVLSIDAVETAVRLISYSQDNLITNILVNDIPTCYQVISRKGSLYAIQFLESDFTITVFNKREWDVNNFMPIKVKKEDPTIIKSNMQGLLISVNVKQGDRIEKGSEVAIVEAMKSQNIICSAVDGKVKRIVAQVGKRVSEDEIIIELER